MKKTIIVPGIIIVILVGFGVYFLTRDSAGDADIVSETTQSPAETQVSTSQPAAEDEGAVSIIGKSVEGRDIVAYNFGTGGTNILFVGGIHGGYEWNTSLVAYEMTEYLKNNPEIIPENIRVTVIPVLNPDGLSKVVGTAAGIFNAADITASQAVQVSARYNAHTVDLNRNFDCDWQSSGKWQNITVSGGSAAFSEPESLAVKTYIEDQKPVAVVVWYSAAGGVFASNCHNGVLPETNILTDLYSKASGYPAYDNFDFYEITGDMVNWLAKENIPAISVLLTNHIDTEWAKNQKGIEAVLNHYAK